MRHSAQRRQTRYMESSIAHPRQLVSIAVRNAAGDQLNVGQDPQRACQLFCGTPAGVATHKVERKWRQRPVSAAHA